MSLKSANNVAMHWHRQINILLHKRHLIFCMDFSAIFMLAHLRSLSTKKSVKGTIPYVFHLALRSYIDTPMWCSSNSRRRLTGGEKWTRLPIIVLKRCIRSNCTRNGRQPINGFNFWTTLRLWFGFMGDLSFACAYFPPEGRSSLIPYRDIITYFLNVPYLRVCYSCVKGQGYSRRQRNNL